MEQIIQDKLIQPKGLAAFGWGLLGFFGMNISMNIIFTIVNIPIFAAMETSGDIWGLAVFPIYAAVVFGAYKIMMGFKYQATRTGCTVALIVQGIGFCIGLFIGATA